MNCKIDCGFDPSWSGLSSASFRFLTSPCPASPSRLYSGRPLVLRGEQKGMACRGGGATAQFQKVQTFRRSDE
jgi:hypothetical protein